MGLQISHLVWCFWPWMTRASKTRLRNQNHPFWSAASRPTQLHRPGSRSLIGKEPARTTWCTMEKMDNYLLSIFFLEKKKLVLPKWLQGSRDHSSRHILRHIGRWRRCRLSLSIRQSWELREQRNGAWNKEWSTFVAAPVWVERNRNRQFWALHLHRRSRKSNSVDIIND